MGRPARQRGPFRLRVSLSGRRQLEPRPSRLHLSLRATGAPPGGALEIGRVRRLVAPDRGLGAADLRRRFPCPGIGEPGDAYGRLAAGDRADAGRFRDLRTGACNLGAGRAGRRAGDCLRQHRRLQHRQHLVDRRRRGAAVPDCRHAGRAETRWAGHAGGRRRICRVRRHRRPGPPPWRGLPRGARRLCLRRVPAGECVGGPRSRRGL